MIGTILIALSGISQTTTADSSRIPNYQLIGAIKDIESYKILKQEYAITVKKLGNRDSLIVSLKDRIGIYVKQDTLYKQLIRNYVATEQNQKEQIQKYFDLYTQSQKDLRKQKRKTFWSRVGVIVVGSGVYLLTRR